MCEVVFLRVKVYRRFLVLIFSLALLFSIFFLKHLIEKEIPDEVNVFAGDEIVINTSLPISYTLPEKYKEVLAVSKNEQNYYYVKIKLFGIIPAKNVKVKVIEKKEVIPCGFQIGIYLHTKGVLVIDTDNVTDVNGITTSPAKNIIMPDDYIVSLNNISVSTKSQLIFLINKYGKDDIILKIRRKNAEIDVKIKPVCTGENEYKAGIWVRDDSQGIGTMTYIDEDGNFAGLGHGINDIDTGNLLDSKNGILYRANIWGINKGKEGTPGGLLGSIEYEESNELGKITNNTNNGIYGKINEKFINEYTDKLEPMSIGLKQEISEGRAYIRSGISGEIRDYEIEIKDIDYSSENKGMVIKITDENLLTLTNGIVQGMSGSPIIQNGKIIGAVTHVFVDDPTRGYGIFIENMLEH